MIKTNFLNGNKDQGVALVIAVLLTFVFASIAIAVSNFSEQGYQLAQSSRESTYALYAADTGIECALYFDLKENRFFSSVGSNTTVNCGSGNRTATYYSSGLVSANCPRLGTLPTSYEWCYKFDFEVDNGSLGRNYKSDVQIGYDQETRYVKIVSQGYNDTGNKAQQREIVYEYSF